MNAQHTHSTADAWRERLDLDYTPSAYQAAIFDFVDNGKGNGMAVAVAGAGKSTSLAATVQIAMQHSRYVLALAFNVDAKDALEKKLEGTGARVKTVHGQGYAALGYSFGYDNIEVAETKYRDLVDRYIAEFEAAQTLAGDDCSPQEVRAILDDGYPRAAIIKLLELARLDLLDAFANDFGRRLRGLADHHDVDVDPVLGQLVTDVVRLAMQWGIEHPRTVDYTDMVWLPTVLRLRPWTADWVFVDEAQDISKAHRALIRASMKREGRALFVGDPKQAIYGFAGADADSFKAIVREFDCAQLPLSVCYRCPTSVLDLAREIVPQIEARPGAPEGIVRSSTIDAFVAEAQRGDMVLCRLNAPLLGVAFKLIGAGTSARVRGRADLGEGLAKIIKRCSKGLRKARGDDRAEGLTATSWRDSFGDALEAWEEREKDSASKRYGKRGEDALAQRLEAIADQAGCIRVIWAGSGAVTAAELQAAVASLFDDPEPAVVLSSIHRAKGLEAPRVFVAMPDRLGVAWPGSRPWMEEQEQHLKYVCLTRAKTELVFLREAGVSGTTEATAANDAGRPQLTLVQSGVEIVRALPASSGACTECGEDVSGQPVLSVAQSLDGPGHHRHVDCADAVIDQGEIAPTDTPPEVSPLPPPDADAPDTYDPGDPPARVALARRLDAELRRMGFRPTTVPQGHEAVYDRVSDDLMVIRVHSTVEAGEVRGVGQDAIRFSLLRDTFDGLVPVGKTKRVNRVGLIDSIIDRVRTRVRMLATQAEGQRIT